MRTASNTYNRIIANDSHRFEVKINIAGVDYGEDKILSCKSDSKVFATEPTIGGTYSATLEFSILDDGANIPRMAKVIPYFRVTDGTNTSEWIKYGEFYIDTRSVSMNNSGISVFDAFCYDAMLKANAPYSESSLSWPAKAADILAEICSKLGIEQDARNPYNMNPDYFFQLPVGYTYREVLSFIASAYGSNFFMNDEGALRLAFISEAGTLLNVGDNITTLSLSPRRPLYTKVILHTGDTTQVVEGVSDDNVLEAQNPFATQEMAQRIYASVSGDQSHHYTYRPFDASGAWVNPLVELCDSIRTKKVANTGPIASRVVNFGSGMVMDLSAPNDNYIDHEYAYESPEERQYKRTIAGLESSITIAEGGIELLSKQVNNIGGRNLMINTLSPSVATIDDLPRVVGQPYHTEVNDWVPSVAEHGFMVTKGTITPTGLIIFFGTQTQEYQGNLGLTPGETYTISFGVEGKLLSNVRQNTYLRFSVGTWDSGGTAAIERFNLANFTPGQLFSEKCKATFTLPANAVNTILQIDVRYEGSGTEPTQYLATDYLELTNIMLEQGEVATAWTPAPEDFVGNDEIIAKINISPEQIVIDANKVNLRGYVTFTNLSTSGDTIINGANITTGLITDARGKNSWNLDTGALTITDGTINITTSAQDYSAIKLSYLSFYAEMRPAGIIVGATDSQKNFVEISENLINIGQKNDATHLNAGYSKSGFTISKLVPVGGGVMSVGVANLNGSDMYLGMIGSSNPQVAGADGKLSINSAVALDTIVLDGSAGSISAKGSLTIDNGTNSLTYTPGSYDGMLALRRGSNYTFLLWPDSNGSGRIVLGDGTSTKWRTELTNSGLVFRNSSDAVTAQYHGNRSDKVVSAYPSAVTTANGTETKIGSVTLGVGLWIITANCMWQRGGTGRRTFRGKAASESSSGWTEIDQREATNITSYAETQKFVAVKNISAQTAYDFYATQASGGNLDATLRVQAVQIA